MNNYGFRKSTLVYHNGCAVPYSLCVWFEPDRKMPWSLEYLAHLYSFKKLDHLLKYLRDKGLCTDTIRQHISREWETIRPPCKHSAPSYSCRGCRYSINPTAYDAGCQLGGPVYSWSCPFSHGAIRKANPEGYPLKNRYPEGQAGAGDGQPEPPDHTGTRQNTRDTVFGWNVYKYSAQQQIEK